VGRTGKIWASDLYGITPDIMCVSKSIGGGIPISSVVYREEYDNLPTAFHLGTYRGNPLGLAAGAAILEYLMKGNLLDRVTKYGRNILSRFQDMMNEYGVIGDVRGKGFMIGVELVKNGTTLPNQEIAQKLRDVLFQNGLLMHTCGHYGNVMRFMAPLTIEDDLIDNGLEIFESSIREVIK
jgi:4-aminobutyrate aminotransferase-like enzyme